MNFSPLMKKQTSNVFGGTGAVAEILGASSSPSASAKPVPAECVSASAPAPSTPRRRDQPNFGVFGSAEKIAMNVSVDSGVKEKKSLSQLNVQVCQE